MGFRDLIIATVVGAGSLMPLDAPALDDLKYLDLKGKWQPVAVPAACPT
jgi:hypothetical protein